MDLIRGICIVLVCILHAASVLERQGLEVSGALNAFNDLFAPYRMPTLMFLSGMMLGRSLEKPAKIYLWGKFDRIYWSYLLWRVIALLVHGVAQPWIYIQTLFFTTTYLWYLWNLFAYYLIAHVMVRLRIPLVSVIVMCMVVVAFVPDIARSDRFAFLFAFFLLGHLVASNRIEMKGRLLPFLAGGSLAVLGAVLSATGTPLRYDVRQIWAPLAMIAALLSVAPFYRAGSLGLFGTLMEWVGRNSLVFYVSHQSILWVTALILMALGMTGFWPSYLLCLAVFTGCATALVVLQSRSTVVAALFDLGPIRRAFSSLMARRYS